MYAVAIWYSPDNKERRSEVHGLAKRNYKNTIYMSGSDRLSIGGGEEKTADASFLFREIPQAARFIEDASNLEFVVATALIIDPPYG